VEGDEEEEGDEDLPDQNDDEEEEEENDIEATILEEFGVNNMTTVNHRF